jgi:pimeloyl-ACP methyl ester carboxylesterase
MGGFIAADLAARAPERVERLVLVDAPLLPSGRGLPRLAAAGALGGWRLPLPFLPVLVADALRAGPFTLRRASLDLLRADLTPRLSRIAAPSLVIWGERDRFFSAAYGRRVAEALPDAEFVAIPGAGHNPMWDQPAAFNRVVTAFLA